MKSIFPDKYVARLSEWHTPATDYPDCEIGNFRVHHGKYTKGYYRNWGVKGYVLLQVLKAIPIVSLQEKRDGRWRGWMVDDPPQWWAMQIYAQQAHGRVLTTGLGLGLICHELVKNPNVTQITVVEKSPEVIELIRPFIPAQVDVVTGDFYEFIKSDKTAWDTLIVDLWVTRGKTEKLETYFRQVIPLGAQLRPRYPNASLTFHGFQTVSDIKPVSEEMVKIVTSLDI